VVEREKDAYEQHHPRELIRDLVERKLDWRQIHSIQSGEKDPDRFDKYLSADRRSVAHEERVAPAVRRVRHARVADRGEVDADLVLAPRLRQHAHVRVAAEALQDLVRRG
jgi:hypothetical protein